MSISKTVCSEIHLNLIHAEFFVTVDTVCDNGVEIVPEDALCNGSVECYDCSDENICRKYR